MSYCCVLQRQQPLLKRQHPFTNTTPGTNDECQHTHTQNASPHNTINSPPLALRSPMAPPFLGFKTTNIKKQERFQIPFFYHTTIQLRSGHTEEWDQPWGQQRTPRHASRTLYLPPPSHPLTSSPLPSQPPLPRQRLWSRWTLRNSIDARTYFP